jgi:hypothetical protein
MDGNYHDGGGNQHLYSMTGFLDPDWFDRAGWVYNNDTIMIRAIGKNRDPGSKIMVFDEEMIYYWGLNGISLRTYDYWDPFFLASARIDSYNQPVKAKKETPEKHQTKTKGKSKKGDKGKPKGKQKPGEWPLPFEKELMPNRFVEKWKEDYKNYVRGMVLTDHFLFVAGARGDWVTSEAAMNGEEGMYIEAISLETGQSASQIQLEAMPVWDGLIVADQNLFITLSDGTLSCME